MLNRGSSRWSAALASLAVLLLTAAPAAAEEASPGDSGSAQPSPTSTIPNLGPQTAGSPVCTVTANNVDKISGMVTTAEGIVAVESGQSSQVETWLINPATCEATRRQHGFAPRDPQDIALGTDGALWILDNVDNQPWITFERIDPGTGKATPYRAAKPAETISPKGLIMDADNLPILISASNASAVLYKPSAPLQPDIRENLPPLTKVGTMPLLQTNTPSPSGLFDQRFVSGAAVSADRTKVVVRTKSDAYEFTLSADTDIVTTLTSGTPVITPLPMEEDGQAITYSSDGAQFLTLSMVKSPVLRSYTPYVPPPPTPAVPAGGGGGGGLDFGDITTIATVTGSLGMVAVIVGIIGIVRFRRNVRDQADHGDYDDDARPPRPRRRSPDDAPRRAPARVGPGEEYGHEGYGHEGYGHRPPSPGPYDQALDPGYGDPHGGYGQPPAYGQPGSGQVYGGGQYGQPPAPPPPYGQPGGSVYGGGVYGGGQYGEPAAPPPPPPPAAPPRRGGTYGRPTRPEDEPPRRGGYGRDNIDM